ncbi:MAG: hypothetical protein FWE87_05075 [Coriobacteriia bacterium]|nr:hypothetical protein [Coriobacteriia bacterium]
MFKRSKLVLATMIALIMCASGIGSVFAADPGYNDKGALIGTEQAPAQAAITKVLKLPVGTAIPKADYQFIVKSMNADGEDVSGGDTLGLMPSIDPITITYTSDETSMTAEGISSVYKQSVNIFANADEFSHAGIYKYQIFENEAASYQSIDSEREVMDFSDALYEITVFVKDKTDGTGTYIYAVVAETLKTDGGENGNKAKVDPSPGGDGETYRFSKLEFTNTYVKTNIAPDGPDPLMGSMLSLSKTVEGDFASSSMYFPFTLSFEVPSLVDMIDPQPYKAYIVENGAVVTSHENADDLGEDDYGFYIPVANKSNAEIRLKDGQKLVFVNLPVGTSYKIEETGTTSYLPSYTITYAGKKGMVTTGTLSQDLATGTQWVGEMINSADYINTRDQVTPTGLNLNDLPFIGMIVVALSAAAISIAIKSRKRNTVTAA